MIRVTTTELMNEIGEEHVRVVQNKFCLILVPLSRNSSYITMLNESSIVRSTKSTIDSLRTCSKPSTDVFTLWSITFRNTSIKRPNANR